jgi:hypothetical protein
MRRMTEGVRSPNAVVVNIGRAVAWRGLLAGAAFAGLGLALAVYAVATSADGLVALLVVALVMIAMGGVMLAAVWLRRSRIVLDTRGATAQARQGGFTVEWHDFSEVRLTRVWASVGTTRVRVYTLELTPAVDPSVFRSYELGRLGGRAGRRLDRALAGACPDIYQGLVSLPAT